MYHHSKQVTQISERITLMFTTSEETSHQHAVSDVSGGPYCNCNVKRGTETYAANLIFIW